MKRNYKIAILFVALAMVVGSCVKDLDTKPLNPLELTSEDVYADPANYINVLAKLYAGLALSGQQGPAGQPDISGIDEGFGQYLRGYWYHQELTTDEAVIGWNDQTIKDFHDQDWGSSDVFIAAMYYRLFYQVSLCNEFIRETTPEKLAERGITGAWVDQIATYHAEARFLRALSYYHAMDLFGNVPFVTEDDPVGKFFPEQIQRANLFDYIDAELNAIEPLLRDPRQNEYGRADKAAVWSLLAKMYLNAEVYKGVNRYSDCVTNCEKVINAGYSLETDYQNLFLADNHNSPEAIFTINFDGLHTQTWGGTTFIIHAAVGGTMNPADFGIGGGWGGTRTTSALVAKFPEDSYMFYHSPRAPKSTVDYTLLYVPGSYQGWDPANTTTVLASVLDDGNFEGYLNFPDANTEFKFCATPDWDNNYGDDTGDGTLEPGGANIVAADAGYYFITVDLNALTYTTLKTDWGVIGSATAGGWDTDQNMTYDTGDGLWKATLDLTEGEIKFRANDDWGLNYGGSDGILVRDGANIAIPAAGTYLVTMKLGIPDYTYTIEELAPPSVDHRAMFWTDGQSLEINDIGNFNDGYAITKWKNVTSTGVAGSDATYCDTDFLLFRLADVYLMYAEAVLRGGGGSQALALQYVNDIRTRAYGDISGNIGAGDLTLDFILDERGRELYWEATRRTDLIRYGKFTGGTYLWPWKGGIKNGTSTAAFYNLFPLPAADVSANPNLIQNTGY